MLRCSAWILLLFLLKTCSHSIIRWIKSQSRTIIYQNSYSTLPPASSLDWLCSFISSTLSMLSISWDLFRLQSVKSSCSSGKKNKKGQKIINYLFSKNISRWFSQRKHLHTPSIADSTHNVIFMDALIELWGMILLPKILHKLSHAPGTRFHLLLRCKYPGGCSKWQQE